MKISKNKKVTINGLTGEYTGFSYPGLHYFSMYNGSVIKLSELEAIRLFGIDFFNPNLGSKPTNK